jgi:hypothetical protein
VRIDPVLVVAERVEVVYSFNYEDSKVE